MTSRLVVSVILLAAAGSAQVCQVQVTASVDEVELGRPFPLTVVRMWKAGVVPERWSDAALSPLVAQALGVVEEQGASGTVRETRRFLCRAFVRGQVTIPAVSMRVRPDGGGPERSAASDPITLPVRSSLDAGSVGPIELPGGTLAAPFRWQPWWFVFAACVLALVPIGLRMWSRRTRVAGVARPPHEWARERLQRLEGEELGDAAFHVEMSSLIREYVEGRWSLRASRMSTQELLLAEAAAPTLKADARALLGECLGRCDVVKFAPSVPGGCDREPMLRLAFRFVQETAPARDSSGELA